MKKQKIVANVNKKSSTNFAICNFEIGTEYPGYNVWFETRNGTADCFIITGRKRVTDTFIDNIAEHLNLPWETVKYRITKAKLQVKTLSNGRIYNDISGDHWGGAGLFWDDVDSDIILMEF